MNLFRRRVLSAFSTCFPASYGSHRDDFAFRRCLLVAVIDEFPFRVWRQLLYER